MLIGIDFGDNDFNITVRAFLKLFVDSSIVESHPKNVTKENILKVWNECFYGIYLITQNGFGYQTSIEDEKWLKKHLILKERHIYLGQECLDRISQDNNCEFTCIETDKGEIFNS